jgi:hypothetical protein
MRAGIAPLGCLRSVLAEAIRRNRQPKGLISRWQGTYEAPPPVVEAIQKENAETLLKKLIELNDPRYIPAGFILAVMLERKRILKVKEQIVHDGKRTIIYEQPKTGEVLTITDPDLHLNQLEAVQHDVAHLLEHGLNPPPAVETPVAATETATTIEAAPVQLRRKRPRRRRTNRSQLSVSAVSDLAALQARLGHTFRDESLLRLALTHPSVAHEQGTPIQHNQRLEFLGDAVLQLALTRELYEKFPAFDEGPLTKARAKMVNRRTLAVHGRALALGEHLS